MYRKLPKEKQTAYERWELASFEEMDEQAARRKPISPNEVDFGPHVTEPESDVQWEMLAEDEPEAEAVEAEALEAAAGEDAQADEQDEGTESDAEQEVLAEDEAETGAVEAEVLEAAVGGDAQADEQDDGPESDAKQEEVLAEDEPDAGLEAEASGAVEAPAVMAPMVTQATIEDVHALIEGLRKEAREAGYRAGMEEGLAAGLEEGRAKGYEEGLARGLEEGTGRGEKEGFEKGYGEGRLEGEEYARTLKAVAAGFAADVARAHEAIAGDVLALALDFAKAMMKTALKVKPALLVPVVADAVRYLPSLQQPAVLYLNAEDAVIVRQAMGEELEKAGMRLAEEDVPRGSCRIETGSNRIDSSLATRWQRLAGSLGQQSDWMEQE